MSELIRKVDESVIAKFWTNRSQIRRDIEDRPHNTTISLKFENKFTERKTMIQAKIELVGCCALTHAPVMEINRVRKKLLLD